MGRPFFISFFLVIYTLLKRNVKRNGYRGHGRTFPLNVRLGLRPIDKNLITLVTEICFVFS